MIRKLRDVERETILGALVATGGSVITSAEALGISVRKLQYRLRAWEAPSGRDPAKLAAWATEVAR